MRILMHGPSWWAKSAYGHQIRFALEILREAGHTVGQSCLFGFQGRQIKVGDVDMFPPKDDPYGNDVIDEHAARFGADYVLSLGDVFFNDSDVWGRDFRWVAWTTVDSSPLWPDIKRALHSAHTVIGYSRYGQGVLQEAGFDARYVPLCYDPDVFYPGDTTAAREMLGLPNNRFIVTMVQANRARDDRKALFVQIAAFREFQKAHPDAFLYIHTCRDHRHGGVPLLPLLDELEMREGRDYMFVDQYAEVVAGATDEQMRATYNACDVLLQATKAEAFGVPALEAQACGKPVVYTNFGALAEVASGYPVEWFPEWQPAGAWYAYPLKGSITNMLHDAYHGRVLPGDVSDYKIEAVAEQYWKPFLLELEAGI